MKVAKQAVQYYCLVTGKEWSDFFSRLDEAVQADENTPDKELWLIKRLTKTIVDNGVSVNKLKANKDDIKSVFAIEDRKKAGEFFTPEVWCKEGRTYLDKHIPNWHEMNVWDASCYTMDTEIYTQRGWVRYDDLNPEADRVYTYNLTRDIGEWSKFGNCFKRESNFDYMVSIKTSDFDICVTPEHRMLVKSKQRGTHFVEAKELLSLEEDVLIPRAAGVRSHTDPYTITAPYRAAGKIFSNARTEDDFKSVQYVVREPKFTPTFGLLPSFDAWLEKLYSDSTFCKEFIIGILESDNCLEMSNVQFIKKYLFYTETASVADIVEKTATLAGYAVKVNKSVKGYWVLISEARFGIVSPKNVQKVSAVDCVWDLTTESDNHNFLVRRNGKVFFSGNCGSGNLMRTAGHPVDKLFLSSLQDDDVELVKNTPEYEGATVFQLDFLNSLDYDQYNTDFLDKLPPRLKDIIVNDKGLIFYMNPPYGSGEASRTDVGVHMCEIGLSKAAYDLFYHFVWRVMHFVEMFSLRNVYFCAFGPLTWFTMSSPGVLLEQFEHCFEFVDGMCISAQDFSGTSSSIAWGIGCSLWKARGGYQPNADAKPILLDKKVRLMNGTVSCEGKVQYSMPRERLSEWVKPKDVLFYDNAPVMTSHLTFKGSDVNSKVAPNTGKIASNALGVLMTGNIMTRGADKSAILSMPTTIESTSITEENFWRCVASFAYRRSAQCDWAVTKKELSAPDTSIEGYEEWLRNSLVFFLFEWKSMVSSLRNVDWCGSNYTIRNKLFFLSEEEVRANCHDPIILKDLEENPPVNQFILKQIEESMPYWVPECKQLFDYCKNYTLFSFDRRKDVDYAGSLECWDAGFQQLRAGLWNDELQAECQKAVALCRDWVCRGAQKFGFLTEFVD